jgi:hypothetical protein
MPWWGTPLFTLLGGLVGALANEGFAAIGEARKRSTSRREADTEKLRILCSDFLEAMSILMTTGANNPKVAERSHDAYRSYMRLRLMAPHSIAQPADLYRRKIHELRNSGDCVLSTTVNQMLYYEHEFLNAVRAEFGWAQLPDGESRPVES